MKEGGKLFTIYRDLRIFLFNISKLLGLDFRLLVFSRKSSVTEGTEIAFRLIHDLRSYFLKLNDTVESVYKRIE